MNIERDMEVLKHRIAELELKIVNMKSNNVDNKKIQALEIKLLQNKDMLSDLENQ